MLKPTLNRDELERLGSDFFLSKNSLGCTPISLPEKLGASGDSGLPERTPKKLRDRKILKFFTFLPGNLSYFKDYVAVEMHFKICIEPIAPP